MPTLNELLHAASRTFAIGIDLLPAPLRAEVEVAYLLLRVSDYLEDNTSMPPERKARLLRLWAEVLEGRTPIAALETALGSVADATPDGLVARNARQVHGALLGLARPEARAIVVRHVRDSTLGMARWAERGPRIGDEADLDDYMHEVAGRVGWLLTELFALDIAQVAARRDEMMRLGREFGLALQTVNVIRGLSTDPGRGWNYIPRSFRGRPEHGPSGHGRGEGADLEALERLVAKAERHLGGARSYLLALPRRPYGVRLFCLLPYFFALRTLALSRENPQVFREEIKMGRPEVRRISAASRLLGWSNTWLVRFGERLSRARA